VVAVGLFAGGATGWGLWLGLLRRWPLGVALAGHDLGLYLAVGALALAGAAAARRHETPIVVGASAAAGGLSHRRWSHLDTPYYLSLVFFHTEYNRGRLNDSTAYG
jgi:hypothetical protein